MKENLAQLFHTGMDNPHYEYAGLANRPTLNWPNDQRISVIVLLHLEYWRDDPPPESKRDLRFSGEYGSFSPDFRTWSQREYGNRVGLARVLNILDQYNLKITVPLNSACVGRHDALISELCQRDVEFVGHGSYANQIISSAMSESDEKALIGESISQLERAVGYRPRGWAGQDYGESARTPSLLAAAGFDYLLDWPNDDQPYLMGSNPGLVSIPRQPEWDDVELLWLRRIPMHRYPEIIADAFDALYDEGGRVFVLSLHPWLIGMAHRIKYLDIALKHITKRTGVWSASAGEVARFSRSLLCAGGKTGD